MGCLGAYEEKRDEACSMDKEIQGTGRTESYCW